MKSMKLISCLNRAYILLLLLALGFIGCALTPNPQFSKEVYSCQNETCSVCTQDNSAEIIQVEEIPEIQPEPLSVEEIISAPQTIRIVAVGDLMLGTRIPDNTCFPKNGDRLFSSEIRKILSRGEVVFGNLEGCICGSGGTAKKKKYVFAMPDAAADWLADAGFNLLSVANNHAGDMQEEGCEITRNFLNNKKIHFAGYLENPICSFTQNGIKIGFIATAPNAGVVNFHNLDWLESTVEKLAAENDIVIVSMHIGAEGKEHQHITGKTEEFLGENRGNPYQLARQMIDAGADLVLGHGPHVTRAIDLYKGRFIAYSLGNFCTYSRVNISGVNGIAPILELVLNENGEFQIGSIYSTKQISRQGVQLDPGNEVLHKIMELTREDIPEAPLQISEDGSILPIDSK